MKTETILHNEIEQCFEQLNEMEVGTEDHKTGVDAVAKLLDKAIEIEKLNIEHENKTRDQEIEVELKQAQLDEDRKDRKARTITAVLSVVIPIVVSTAVTIWGTKKSIEFEKTGTFTTIMGRGFINKLLPKK